MGKTFILETARSTIPKKKSNFGRNNWITEEFLDSKHTATSVLDIVHSDVSADRFKSSPGAAHAIF